eukprot:scaffold19655_cov104-Isochrysis_galbana.AAC.2
MIDSCFHIHKNDTERLARFAQASTPPLAPHASTCIQPPILNPPQPCCVCTGERALPITPIHTPQCPPLSGVRGG